MGLAEVRTATKSTKNGDGHMKTKNKYVGLDVHKDTTVVAVADGGREARCASMAKFPRIWGHWESPAQARWRRRHVARGLHAPRLAFGCFGAMSPPPLKIQSA